MRPYFAPLVAAAAVTLAPTLAAAQVVLYPRPASTVPASGSHTVRINGNNAFVYDVKINPTANHQDVSAPASMLPFGLHGGTANVEVTLPSTPSRVVVRPTKDGITPTINGNKVTFAVTKPGNYSIEFDGKTRPLFLFANPAETNVPIPGTAGVRHFGPGVHNAGRIRLANNERLYLAPGAFVNGYVFSDAASNISIEGRGILHGGNYEQTRMLDPNGNRQRLIQIHNTDGVKINGIITLDSPEWNINPINTRNTTIDNVKVIGWRRNSDSIDPVNPTGLTIRNSFLKGHDDGVTVKGRAVGGPDSNRTVENVLVEGTVHWQNWMRPLVVGGESHGVNKYSNIVFRNIDVLHSGHNPSSFLNRDAALSVWNVDEAHMRDIRFENIRVENSDRLIRLAILKNVHSNAPENVWGRISDVTFKDINAQNGFAGIEITGHSNDYMTRNVTLQNVRVNGQLARGPDDVNYLSNAFTRNVKFVTGSGTTTVVYTDPFAPDPNNLPTTANNFNASAGRTGTLAYGATTNGVATRLVTNATQATPGRYNVGGNSQFAARTFKESVGTFSLNPTYQVSAHFLYADANNTNVNLAGVGLANTSTGVLSASDTSSGVDVVLRSDANTSGKNAVLQITNVVGGATQNTARNNANQFTLSDGRWYQLIAEVTRKSGGLFDITARVFDRGTNGLGGSGLLQTISLQNVSNSSLSSSNLFAGFGMYSGQSVEHRMQAVDEFRVLSINPSATPIPEPTSLALLGLGGVLGLRRPSRRRA